jgi:hypothetical protein
MPTDLLDPYRSASEWASDKVAGAASDLDAPTPCDDWDVAKATHQDTTMPDGLAQSAYDMIHGRFTEERRVGVFKPEIAVPADAPPQARLLAYTGRRPD